MKQLILVVFVALILFPRPAQAQEQPKDPVFRVALGTLIVGHGMDLWTTGKCIGAGTCREANPALAWAQDTEVLFGGLKMAGAAGQVWVLDKLHKKNRKAGRIATFALAAATIGLGIRNAKLMRER